MSVFFENNGHQIQATITLPDGSAVTTGTVTAYVKDHRGTAVGDAAGYALAHVGSGVWSLSLDVLPMVSGGRYTLTVTINVSGIPTQQIDVVVPCSKRTGA